MNVQHLNPIMQAASYVLKEMCKIEISVGKPYLTQVSYQERMFIVMIGITGELQGQVILSMSESVACQTAMRMMMGIRVSELNDLAKSAICELMNMTMGNAVTAFSKNGIHLDITPPTMFLSDKLTINVVNTKMICIPMTFDEDNLIELNVSIKEK